MKHSHKRGCVFLGVAVGMLLSSPWAMAYDGQKCSQPGVCWEAKPGFPQQVVGSKYDPKHDPKEIAKQGDSIKQMEARNKLRVDYFKKSGKFVYDVDKIPQQ